MDVRCERCKTEYELDDARVQPFGVTVKCTSCGNVFRVEKRPGLEVQSKEWKVRQPGGNVFTFRELTTLQKWIVERKVGRDDEISLTGQTWKRLGNIPELASFFQVVDEALRVPRLESELDQLRRASTPVAPRTFETAETEPGRPAPDLPPTELRAADVPVSRVEATDPEIASVGARVPEVPPTFSAEELRAAMEPDPSDRPFPENLLPTEHPEEDRPEPAFARAGRVHLDPDLAEDGWDRPVAPRSRALWVGSFLVLALAGAGAYAYFQVWVPAQAQQRQIDAQHAALEKDRANRAAHDREMRAAEERAKAELVAVGRGPAQADAGLASRTDGGVEGSGALALGDPPPPAEAAEVPGSVAAAEPEPPVRATVLRPLPPSEPAHTGRKAGARAREPQTYDDWIARGDRLRGSERAAAALDAYARALELAPNRSEGFSGQGLAQLDLGHAAIAIGSFQRALELNPRYGVALMGLAEAYRQLGRKADARQAYERYLILAPEGAEAGIARAALERLKE